MRERRRFSFVATLLVVLFGTQAAFALLGLVIGVNFTGSQPYRFFLVLKGRTGERGDRIAFRFPGSRYYPEGTRFIKEIRGVPGDRLEIREDRTVWLNGEFLDRVRATDSKGRAVEPFRFAGIIPDDAYFLYARAPNSYDSRYFGLIKSDRVVGRAVPLF